MASGGVLARARIVLEGDTVALTRSLQGATAAMEQAGRRMTRIGRGITTKVTLPILAVGIGAIKAFADFDDAMTQSIAIMGDVSDVMRNKMAEAAREVARSTTIGSKKAAESFFFLASAGLTAQQSVAALPQVAKFAQAGMFDMATATDLATDAQSALGLSVDNARQNLVNLTRVTDVLVKANTLANASVLQFAEALTREAGATLKSFKISIEEGVAVLAAFADQGVKASIAGASLSRVVRLLTQAATRNKVELNELGIAVFDDEEKIRNLADIVEDMENSFGAMSDETRTAALESIGFTAKVQGIILPLLGTSKAIRAYQKALEDAKGITEEIAAKQLKSFTAQLKLAWNQIVLAADAAAGTLAPELRSLAVFVKDVARGFEELDESTRKAIVVTLGLAATVGPAILIVGGMTLAIAKLATGLTLLLVPTANATRALVLLRVVVSPGSLLLVGLGVLAVMLLRAHVAAGKAARAMDDANEKFEASLGLLTPETAAKTVEKLEASVEALRDRLTGLNRDLMRTVATEGIVSDATNTVVTANIEAIAVLKDLGRVSQRQIEETIAGVEEEIKTRETHLRILKEVAAAALAVEEDGDKKGKGKTGVNALLKLEEAMKGLKDQMLAITRLNELFGDSFDLANEQARALETGIQDLIMAGAEFDQVVGPNGETLKELAARYIALTAEIGRTERAQVAADDAMADAANVIESVQTKTEIYNETMARLGVHLASRRIEQETFNRAAAQAKDVLEGATVAGEEFGNTLQQAGQQALDSFVSFTTRAGASFRQFIDDAIRDLQRLTFKLALTKIFETVIKAGKTGGGDTTSSRHGGFIASGGLSLVGEAGPELIRAGRGGVTVQPLRGMDFASAGGGGGGGAQVALTIVAVDARSFAQLVEADPSAITEPLLRALHRSSVLGRAMRR